jgi:HlyD family secretion protein
VQNVVTYDVVISVQNPDEILFPSMTAYVNVIIAERENVLLVPNAALRYKPKDFKKENHRKTTGDANQTVKKDISKSNEQKRATVFVLKDGKPEAVRIKIGITDNKFTEILSDNLKVGDQIITDEVEQGGGKGRSGSMMKMF